MVAPSSVTPLLPESRLITGCAVSSANSVEFTSPAERPRGRLDDHDVQAEAEAQVRIRSVRASRAALILLFEATLAEAARHDDPVDALQEAARRLPAAPSGSSGCRRRRCVDAGVDERLLHRRSRRRELQYLPTTATVTRRPDGGASPTSSRQSFRSRSFASIEQLQDVVAQPTLQHQRGTSW